MSFFSKNNEYLFFLRGELAGKKLFLGKTGNKHQLKADSNPEVRQK